MKSLSIRVGSDDEILRLQAALDGWPERAARARTRALRTLAPWLERETLRAAVAASGINPFTWRALARFQTRVNDDSLGVWLGTNEIPAHHLGDIRWNRQMPGATAGGRLFPRSWSWEPPMRTGGLLMRRRGAERLPIEPVYWEIHAEVLAALEGLLPQINTRYQSLMQRELERELQDAA